jgi:hypothetical protein
MSIKLLLGISAAACVHLGQNQNGIFSQMEKLQDAENIMRHTKLETLERKQSTLAKMEEQHE